MVDFRSTAQRWGLVSRGFHWVMAVLIIVMLTLGYVMVDYPMSTTKLKLFANHKSIGITILALALLRIAWRLAERRPLLPESLSVLERRTAIAVHTCLYMLMVAMPFSGWIINSSAGFPLNWFGLASIPPIVAADPDLQATAEWVHGLLASLLATLVLLHIGAALHHQFIKRDGLLRRMLW